MRTAEEIAMIMQQYIGCDDCPITKCQQKRAGLLRNLARMAERRNRGVVMDKYAKGRAITRGSRLLEICKKAKPFLETDGNYYCYGIIDLRDEEPIEDCRKCKAYFCNIDW